MSYMTMIRFAKHLALICLLSLNSKLVGQIDYHISGKITGIKGKEVYIGSLYEKTDSIKCDSDSFTFNGQLETPRLYFLFMESKGFIPLFVDSVPINISGTYALENKQFAVNGSNDCNLYWEYAKKINTLVMLKKVYQEKKDNNGYAFNFYSANLIDSIENETRDLLISSFFKTKSKYLRANIVASVLNQKDDGLVQLLGGRMIEDSISLDDFSDFKSYYEIVKKPVSDWNRIIKNIFTQPPFSLSFAGHKANDKFILIDFWTTWCGPCIKSHQILKDFLSRNSIVKAYGVVLDKDSEGARQVINKKQKEIPGTQIIPNGESEVKRIASELAINVYPTYILLDSTGALKMRKSGIDGLQEIIKFLENR